MQFIGFHIRQEGWWLSDDIIDPKKQKFTIFNVAWAHNLHSRCKVGSKMYMAPDPIRSIVLWKYPCVKTC